MLASSLFNPGHKCHSPHYNGPYLSIRPCPGKSEIKLSHPSILFDVCIWLSQSDLKPSLTHSTANGCFAFLVTLKWLNKRLTIPRHTNAKLPSTWHYFVRINTLQCTISTFYITWYGNYPTWWKWLANTCYKHTKGFLHSYITHFFSIQLTFYTSHLAANTLLFLEKLLKVL